MARVARWMAPVVVLLTIGDAVRTITAGSVSDDSKQVVQRFFAAINRGDAKAAADEFAAGALNYGEAVPRDARVFFQTAIEDILHTFPDWRMTVVDLVAEGESVVALCRVTGTHHGVGHLALNGGLLIDVQPTDRKIDVIADEIDRNKTAVREFFERENARDTSNLPTRVQLGFADIIRTFPDWHWSVLDVVGQGDSVVALVRASGTHRGVSRLPLTGALLVGVQSTGKHVDVWHIHWFKLVDGRITSDYRVRDDIGLYKQLGLLSR
jgi:predicted ester cyclase